MIVESSAPTVTAGADGAMRITMPDLIVHLTRQGDEITIVAMTVDMALKVTPHPTVPTIASLPIMIELELATFAPLLSAVPLPAVAGVRLTNLNLGTTGSYVTLSGALN